MNRRDFVRFGWGTVIASGAGTLRPAFAQSLALGQVPAQPQHPMGATSGTKATERVADFTLQIAPMMVELAPQVVISTIGYSNKVPGPLLRVREGQPVTVDVMNDTDVPEYVHWHGLFVPSEVDGAEEEGSPPVPPHGRQRCRFVAKPAGSRWYHSHTAAMMDLHRGTYTGQFGFFMIDSANDPGLYDQEVFLALREWEHYLSTMDQDAAADPNDPMPEKPATPDPRPTGLEVAAPLHSINDKMLGAGDPLRVRPGERVLMHLLNASASQIHRIGLFGHHFQVIALDGNPVPAPQPVDVIEIGPGERVDAIVEMNLPGVWILGELRDVARQSGMGIVVEYANQPQPRPQWLPPRKARWDYTFFGQPASHLTPDETIAMVFEKVPGGPHGINHWLVNGKEYPHEREFVFRQGGRYRLVFHNRSDDSHPLHMHRHLFELVDLNGNPTAGIKKDTVIVPAFGRVTVDLVADRPGLTLFHCHIQQHMDFGFRALFRYA